MVRLKALNFLASPITRSDPDIILPVELSGRRVYVPPMPLP
jgi:hypothetical protein